MKIEVTLDICYPNITGSPTMYCYDNILAVNAEQQEIIEQCLQEMIANKDYQLLAVQPYLLLGNYECKEENRTCLLDTANKSFIFEK